MIVLPIHESNDCHAPPGTPDGGRFCAKPGGGVHEPGRTPASPLLAAAFPKGALEVSNPNRPKTVEDLTTFIINGYANAFGVTPHPTKLALVPSAMNIWGEGAPGGFYVSELNAKRGEDKALGADGNTLFLNPRTMQAVTAFLADTPETPAAQRKADLEDGLAVLVHELAHSQSPQARAFDADQTRAGDNPHRDLWVNRMLEEGMASYVGFRAIQRLVPSSRYVPEHQGYWGGRALWERLDERHGTDAVREAYRADSRQAREAVLQKYFPNMKDPFEQYSAMFANDMIGPPNARKLVKQVLEARQDAPLLQRVIAARSLDELRVLKAEAHRLRPTLTVGQQFELAEQWGLKAHELSR